MYAKDTDRAKLRKEMEDMEANPKINFHEIDKNGNHLMRLVGDDQEHRIDLMSAAEDLYEALKTLPAPKSILAEAAYTGADVPKKWISDRGNYIDGYNQALKDVKQRSDKAVAKADGGK